MTPEDRARQERLFKLRQRDIYDLDDAEKLIAALEERCTAAKHKYEEASASMRQGWQTIQQLEERIAGMEGLLSVAETSRDAHIQRNKQKDDEIRQLRTALESILACGYSNEIDSDQRHKMYRIAEKALKEAEDALSPKT